MPTRASSADESTPLVLRETRDTGATSRRMKYGVIAACVGAMLVVAAATAMDAPTTRSASLGVSDDSAVGTMAAARAAHRAHLGDENTTEPSSALEGLASEQIPDLVQQVKDLTDENFSLEEDVAALHAEIVATRDTFLRVGHGGSSNHLAGSHDNEIIADLENQNKDMLYELQKTKKRKYELYLALVEADKTVAELDNKFAESEKTAADAVSANEKCVANANTYDKQIENLESQVEMLVADLQARDEAKPAPFDFFCAEENETCECAHGDVVYAARHEEDESKLDLMTVIISKPHVFVTGTDDFVCGNDAAGSDPAVGSTKGCWCAPKGLAEASRGGSRADAADDDEYDDDETSTAATATNYDSAASDDEDSAAADNDTAAAADDTATTADYDDDDTSAAAYNDTSISDDAAPAEADVPSSEFYADAESDSQHISEELSFAENQAHKETCARYCAEEDTMDQQCFEHCSVVLNLCTQACASHGRNCGDPSFFRPPPMSKPRRLRFRLLETAIASNNAFATSGENAFPAIA